MTPPVHASLLRLAEESGLRVAQDGAAVRFSSVESTLALAPVEGGWALTRTLRDGDPEVEVVSDTVDAPERLVVTTVGAVWRSAQGLPPIVTVRRGEPLAGAEVVKDPVTWWNVRWDGHVARELDSVQAATLVRTLAHDVDTLVASYRDPDGLPAFPVTESR